MSAEQPLSHEARLLEDLKASVMYNNGSSSGERSAQKPLNDYIDLVNHPKHYTSSASGVECIQVVEHMSFNLGNAVKYIWRASLKGKQKQDLEKAIWYLQREIKRLYP